MTRLRAGVRGLGVGRNHAVGYHRNESVDLIALAELNENRLAVRPFNMDMSGTMIVRIDHDPQAIYAQDSRHCRTYIKNPSARE